MTDVEKPELIIKGVAASPGVAHGPAFVFIKQDLSIPVLAISDEAKEEEVARFEEGLMETRRQLNSIRTEVSEKIGEDEAQIFDAHLLVTEDRALIEETIGEVFERGENIEACFHRVSQRYIDAFMLIDDPYIKERVSDIKDVSRRLLNNLMGNHENTLEQITEPKILVSDDLGPSDAIHLGRDKVMGIVTDKGSRTSHSVIMARSIEVPAVVGVHDLSSRVQPGDIILIDGYDGIVIINPSEQTLFRYGKIRSEREANERLFNSAKHLPAQTLDGKNLHIMLNIAGDESDDVLRHSGASGIGLLRTEALFLGREQFPDEKEQFLTYKRIAELLSPNPVIIRTLDLGGDKNPKLKLLGHQEANPFMGFRAIRFCLEHQDIFKQQLRAILRSSAFGNVKIMYPMISSLAELIQSNAILEECKRELNAENLAFDTNIQVGSMIEIPAAASIADILADHCDFFSIGTNDLIQYMLAVDRVNDRIAHLYDPNHPSIMRVLKKIIDTAKVKNIPVGICGEMAGEAVYAILLFGFGADEISVSGPNLPEIKYFIRNTRMSEARELASKVLKLERPEDISKLLHQFYLDKLNQFTEST